MSESKSLFGGYYEMAHVWARIQAFDQVFTLYNVCSVHRGMFSTSGGVQYIGGIPFSRFLLFEPAACNVQKINPVGCFNLCH